MKTLLLTLFCLSCLSVQAQFEVRKGTGSARISVGEHVTKAEMESRFGTPKTYNTYFDEDAYEAQVADFHYPEGSFYFVSDRLNGFFVSGSDYSVTIQNKYELKVGSCIEDVIRLLPAEEFRIRKTAKILQIYIKDKATGEFIWNALVVGYDSSGQVARFSWAPAV